DGKSHLLERACSDIDVGLLLEREGQAGNLVVEDRRAHVEGIVLEQDAAREVDDVFRLPAEGRVTVERGGPAAAVAAKLGGDEDQVGGPLRQEIPRIRGQAVLQLPDEGSRAVEMDALVLMQARSEESIEADEVVHVGVRHEDVTDAEELSGRQGLEGSRIEQQGPPLEDEVDVQRRVTEWVVDELCSKALRHRRPAPPVGTMHQRCRKGSRERAARVNSGEPIAARVRST